MKEKEIVGQRYQNEDLTKFAERRNLINFDYTKTYFLEIKIAIFLNLGAGLIMKEPNTKIIVVQEIVDVSIHEVTKWNFAI